jgi:hypothetical protein
VVVDDPRIKRLRELVDQATALENAAGRLVVELTDQLQRSIFLHDNRPRLPDRRRKRDRRRTLRQK